MRDVAIACETWLPDFSLRPGTFPTSVMRSWLLGFWNLLSAIFSMILDVVQYWKEVGRSCFLGGELMADSEYPPAERRQS